MKLGLQIPSFTWPGGVSELRAILARVARGAQDAGFASLWVMDHFFQIEAQYGDACNLYAFDNPQEVRRKLEVLRRHCEDVSQPYDDIERTAIGAFDFGPGGLTSAQAIEKCRQLADAGIQHLIVSLPRVHEMTPIELMGNEIIPAVAGL